MLIGIETNSIEQSAFILEPNINHEASSYLIDNYKDMLKLIKKLDIKEEKAYDLLHDVYISLVESEENGEGFDMEYGSKTGKDESGNLMGVAQFVIGRIKLYAKNNRYRTDIIEASNSYVYQTNTYFNTDIDDSGQTVLNKDGTTKLTKRVEHYKVPITVTSTAASFGDNLDDIDDFQLAFANASVSDSTDDIAEILSIREQIDYCIDVCSLHNLNILNLFKNIDVLSELLGDLTKKKKTAETIFNILSELVDYHTELADSLMDILSFSSKNKALFEAVIGTY